MGKSEGLKRVGPHDDSIEPRSSFSLNQNFQFIS